MRKFIVNWCAVNVPAATVVNDNGNLFITKGDAENYPCVVAHLDQVQNVHSSDFAVIESGGVLFGYSAANKRQEGLGADDKNGIFIALKCLQRYDDIKVALFRGEEVGTVGSSECKLDFFENCRYLTQCDRRGASDMITNISGGQICSDEFIKNVNAANFGYTPASGMLTDVATLSDRGVNLSCINLSCGYYKPHTDEECTVIADLINCYNFVCWIIENLQSVYPYTPEVAKIDTYNYSYDWRGNYFDWYDSYYHNDNDITDYEIENTIIDILSDDQNITFNEMWQRYNDYFGCNKARAKRIYNDVKSFY